MVKYKNIQEYLKQYYSDKETVKFITFNTTSLTLEESRELVISDFPQLKEFSCGTNKITNLDLSNCLQLEKLWCGK